MLRIHAPFKSIFWIQKYVEERQVVFLPPFIMTCELSTYVMLVRVSLAAAILYAIEGVVSEIASKFSSIITIEQFK